MLLILLSVMSLSCFGREGYSNQKVVDTVKKQEVQKRESIKESNKVFEDIDSIEVTCLFFGRHSDKSFTIFSSDISLEGAFNHGDRKRFVIDPSAKDLFILYINKFFINKSASVIVSKEEEPPPIADYPFIGVKGFKGREVVFNEGVTLDRNMNFNPDFLKFYYFLEEIIKEEDDNPRL